MIFPKNIIGPQFDKGDIVTFVFSGAELNLRLPIIPLNKHNEDSVCPIKDFRNLDTSRWSEDDQGNHCEQLVSQSWSFEDARSHDNIALAKLSISLIQVDPHKLKDSSLLNFCTFERLVMNGLAYSFPADESTEQSKSRFFAEQKDRKNINWLRIMIHFDLEKTPIPTMFIPLTQSFFIMISLEIESLHYADRTNPYSDELLKQFECDLFDDFLSHIKIEYSPETIALIDALNNKTPA
jgi:hypothetical protein